MIEVQVTPEFERWLRNLRDRRAVGRVQFRLQRTTEGNFGDVAPVGDGVSEMRIHYGPGYRLYFVRRSPTTIVMLCGGDKDSQERDIRRAKELAQERR